MRKSMNFKTLMKIKNTNKSNTTKITRKISTNLYRNTSLSKSMSQPINTSPSRKTKGSKTMNQYPVTTALKILMKTNNSILIINRNLMKKIHLSLALIVISETTINPKIT